MDPSVNRYFSYASMVIPSNDAFVANGSPVAHPIFDDSGVFVGSRFVVSGDEANDAGTELNDELPENTAFFGQMAPDTGVTTVDPIVAHPGFLPMGSGGILDAPDFAGADFLQPGTDFLGFAFRLVDRAASFQFAGIVTPGQEVSDTPVDSDAAGLAIVRLNGASDQIRVAVLATELSGPLTAAHLHLGVRGQNGPVTVDLGSSILPLGPTSALIVTTLDSSSVGGALAGQADPVGALLAELVSGGVYVNLHTDAYPDGELRGQIR